MNNPTKRTRSGCSVESLNNRVWAGQRTLGSPRGHTPQHTPMRAWVVMVETRTLTDRQRFVNGEWSYIVKKTKTLARDADGVLVSFPTRKSATLWVARKRLSSSVVYTVIPRKAAERI